MAVPPQPEEQVRALCEVLNRHAVRYVVFGSIAGRLHGAELRTIDVDIVPDTSAENLERLANALDTLDPRWRVSDQGPGMKVDGRLEPRHFQGASLAIGLVTAIGYVDVVLQPRGFEAGYTALAPRAVVLGVAGVDVLVGSVDDIIRSKELLAREKDLEHLPELHRVSLEQARAAELAKDGEWPEGQEPEPPGLGL